VLPDYGIKIEKAPQLRAKRCSGSDSRCVDEACESAAARQVARRFGMAASTVPDTPMFCAMGGRKVPLKVALQPIRKRRAEKTFLQIGIVSHASRSSDSAGWSGRTGRVHGKNSSLVNRFPHNSNCVAAFRPMAVAPGGVKAILRRRNRQILHRGWRPGHTAAVRGRLCKGGWHCHGIAGQNLSLRWPSACLRAAMRLNDRPTFDPRVFLAWVRSVEGRTTAEYDKNQWCSRKGTRHASFISKEAGSKLTVVSHNGKKLVAIWADSFFGEGCLARQLLRMHRPPA